MAIRIIITGGTFDRHYDEIQGVLTFRDTHLPEILPASTGVYVAMNGRTFSWDNVGKRREAGEFEELEPKR